MKIAYIANTRIPTEKAHGFQIMKTCEGFAREGIEVTLYVPTRKNRVTEDAFSYYGLDAARAAASFKIVHLAAWDAFSIERYVGSRIAFALQNLSFIRALRRLDLPKETIVFTRDPEVVWFFASRGYKTVYNAHRWPEHHVGAFTRLISGVWKVVANSKGTLAEFEKHGFTNGLAVPNGVDLSQFDAVTEGRDALRKKLRLPLDKKLALYVGHLYEWKGIDVVMEAAERSSREKENPNGNLLYVIVGGTEEDVTRYEKIIEKKSITNVLMLGHQKKADVPAYLKAADVLLLPNIPSTKESEFYTSPIKMFEYMASGVPIVASDLPSIREILSDKNAYLVKAGDSEALAEAVKDITDARRLERHSDASARAKQAALDVREYTWERYSKKVVSFLTSGKNATAIGRDKN